jgi:hypothetical protein
MLWQTTLLSIDQVKGIRLSELLQIQLTQPDLALVAARQYDSEPDLSEEEKIAWLRIKSN